MNVWVCTDHDGHFVGVASVIIAETEGEATALLRVELADRRLNPRRDFTLRRIDLSAPHALVLSDGDY